MPKKEDVKKEQGKKEEENKGEGPSINFLKIDRSLRPDGFHFDNELNTWIKAADNNK